MARTEAFPPDGTRVIASPIDIVTAWRAASTRIPAQYALGTAQHESSFTLNQVDTEVSGFVSRGIYQLSDDEAEAAGKPDADLLSLGDSTAVFVTICETRLDAIIAAATAKGTTIDPASPPDDLWAYLYLAHNQ